MRVSPRSWGIENHGRRVARRDGATHFAMGLTIAMGLRFQPSETGLTAVTLVALFHVAFTAGVLAVNRITAVGYKSGAETLGAVEAITPATMRPLGSGGEVKCSRSRSARSPGGCRRSRRSLALRTGVLQRACGHGLPHGPQPCATHEIN